MEKLKYPKAIAAGSTLLLLLSLLWLANLKRIANSKEEDLKNEKLNSETLLSEKMQLEKRLKKFETQFSLLNDRKRQMTDLVKEKSELVDQQNEELKKIRKEYSSQLKTQELESEAMQTELQMELNALMSSFKELETRDKDLAGNFALLQERNRILKNDLEQAMSAAIDRSLILAVKRNPDKLTIKASRTKKLIASFEVPSQYNSLSYRIFDSNGDMLSSTEGIITSSSSFAEANFVASSQLRPKSNEFQKINVFYEPKEKLKTGVYRVEISNENLYVGSLNVRLR